MLAQTLLFEGLSEAALELVQELAVLEEYSAGAFIFHQGDPSDRLYVIATGQVRISRELGSMGEETLVTLGPGGLFGEMGLFDDSTRSATARADAASVLYSISKEAFDDLLFLHKDLAYEILWKVVGMLADRLRATNDKLALLSVTGRF